MPITRTSGVRIHYEVRGNGRPLVLIHGFTGSARTHWELPGWVARLQPKHRLLLVDVRGHGKSEKPHHSNRYSLSFMADDVLAAMDAAGGFEHTNVMGYSMGAMITMELLLEHGERFDRAVLGGMGATFPATASAGCRDEETGGYTQHFGQPSAWFLSWMSTARHYDHFAKRAAANGTFRNGPVDIERLHEIPHPVLALIGTRDQFCPGTRLLAERIPQCQRVAVAGASHLTSLRDPRFQKAAEQFLASTPSRFDG